MVTTFVVKFVRSRRLFTIKCRNQQSSVSGSPLRSKFSAFHFISYSLINELEYFIRFKNTRPSKFVFLDRKSSIFFFRNSVFVTWWNNRNALCEKGSFYGWILMSWVVVGLAGTFFLIFSLITTKLPIVIGELFDLWWLRAFYAK